MPATIRPMKKTVSFSKDVSNNNNNLESDSDTKQTPQSYLTFIPQIKNSLLVVPFHNIFILVGMFYSGLTQDLETVMWKGFLTSIPIQVIYNYIIYINLLPLKKSTRNDHQNNSSGSAINNNNNNNNNVPLLIGSSIFVSIVLSLPLFVVIILMGAPVYKYSLKTLYLSLHLCQLIFNPLIILSNLNVNKIKRLFKQDHLYRIIFHHGILSSVLLTLGGCWLGVIPIPLDWDRPWQQWPITLLVGGYLGGVVGGVLSLIVNYFSH